MEILTASDLTTTLMAYQVQFFNSALFYQEDLITFIDARTYKARCDEQFKFEVSGQFIYIHMIVNDSFLKIRFHGYMASPFLMAHLCSVSQGFCQSHQCKKPGSRAFDLVNCSLSVVVFIPVLNVRQISNCGNIVVGLWATWML